MSIEAVTIYQNLLDRYFDMLTNRRMGHLEVDVTSTASLMQEVWNELSSVEKSDVNTGVVRNGR